MWYATIISIYRYVRGQLSIVEAIVYAQYAEAEFKEQAIDEKIIADLRLLLWTKNKSKFRHTHTMAEKAAIR